MMSSRHACRDAPVLGSASMSNWRRVSSTHKLEDLLSQPSKQQHNETSRAICGVLLCMGACLVASAASISLTTIHLWSHNLQQQDLLYYVQAATGLLPVSMLAAFATWFSNKLFKHNT